MNSICIVFDKQKYINYKIDISGKLQKKIRYINITNEWF